MIVEIVFEDNDHIYRVPLRALLQSLQVAVSEAELKAKVLHEVYKT